MIHLLLILFTFLIGTNISQKSQNLNICGDWLSYKSDKCFKFINKLGTEDEAKNECYRLERTSTLIVIESAEEQEFLNNHLAKYQTISDKCWLGMNVHELVVNPWNGRHRYTNWKDGSADLIGYHTCVQMSLSKVSLGKWTDEPCRRKALIGCQRRQQWTVDSLRNILDNILAKVESQNFFHLIEVQKKSVETLKKLVDRQQTHIIAQNQSIENFNKTIDKRLLRMVSELIKEVKNELEQIPIGFIYYQLPNQSDPQSLWPRFQWKDITKEYSGLFFRAEGNDSAPFGQIQQANCSDISNIMSAALVDLNYTKVEGRQYELKEGWSSNLVPGKALTDFYMHKSNGEIRPRNTAVRIWKRYD